MQQRYFYYAWGVNADVLTPVPMPTQSGGLVSYQTGYTNNYQLNLASNPSALAIERAKMNAFFNDVTLNLQNYQQYGSPEWIDSTDNQGPAFPYDVGAVVRYRSGSSGPFTTYISLVTNNTTTPGTVGYWSQPATLLQTTGRYLGKSEVSTTGSVTAPVGATKARVIVTGGGAGGLSSVAGSVGSNYFSGAGGGAGGTAFSDVAVVGGTNYACVVGAGGAPNGGAGGNSSFNGSVIGQGAPALTFPTLLTSPGGSGGYASGCDRAVYGGNGSDGQDGSLTFAGNGGASFWGGGGRAGAGGGVPGEAYGSGGGGSYDGGSGGAGAPGYILVEWYA